MSDTKDLLKFYINIESNQIKIKLNNNKSECLTIKDFIQLVLKKLIRLNVKLDIKSVNRYGLFERLNGVELLIPETRLVLSMENLISNKIDYVIRKRVSTSFIETKTWLILNNQKLSHFLNKQKIELQKRNQSKTKAWKSKNPIYFQSKLKQKQKCVVITSKELSSSKWNLSKKFTKLNHFKFKKTYGRFLFSKKLSKLKTSKSKISD